MRHFQHLAAWGSDNRLCPAGTPRPSPPAASSSSSSSAAPSSAALLAGGSTTLEPTRDRLKTTFPVGIIEVRIVVDGGIGAGKSTLLEYLKARLEALGFVVYGEPLVTLFPQLVEDFYGDPEHRTTFGYHKLPAVALMVVERSPGPSVGVFGHRALISSTITPAEYDLLCASATPAPGSPALYCTFLCM